MRLDTECDVILSATGGRQNEMRSVIAAVRDDLLAEHLNVEPERVARTLSRTRSLIATIETLRGGGRSLVPYEMPALSDTEQWRPARAEPGAPPCATQRPKRVASPAIERVSQRGVTWAQAAAT